MHYVSLALLGLAVAILLVLPPSLDPAIRWKERDQRRKGFWKGNQGDQP